jgi:hypothetical protein
MDVTTNKKDGISSFGIGRGKTIGDLQKLIREKNNNVASSAIIGSFFTASAGFEVYNFFTIHSINDKALLAMFTAATGTAAYITFKKMLKERAEKSDYTGQLNHILRS